MALKAIPYQSLKSLIKRCLSTSEDEETAALIKRLRSARQRGYLTSNELEAVCYWKSARAIHHIKSNSAAKIRKATREALKTRSERVRLEALIELRGVSIPMASAILMLLEPRRYGVIDIRVWQLLYKLGTVTKKPKGIGFDFGNWYQFLMIIRCFAKKMRVNARDIERTMFIVHQEYQKGNLYKSS